MYPRSAVFALALLASLILAGCTSGGTASDDTHRGGFYGGVSGGVTRQ